MTTLRAVLSTLFCWILQSPAPSQTPAGPPATDVFLADLSNAGGKWAVGKPSNISNSTGYDNQPSFTPDGSALLFTSARGSVESACGKPQTDIYRYEIGRASCRERVWRSAGGITVK